MTLAHARAAWVITVLFGAWSCTKRVETAAAVHAAVAESRVEQTQTTTVLEVERVTGKVTTTEEVFVAAPAAPTSTTPGIPSPPVLALRRVRVEEPTTTTAKQTEAKVGGVLKERVARTDATTTKKRDLRLGPSPLLWWGVGCVLAAGAIGSYLLNRKRSTT